MEEYAFGDRVYRSISETICVSKVAPFAGRERHMEVPLLIQILSKSSRRQIRRFYSSEGLATRSGARLFGCLSCKLPSL